MPKAISALGGLVDIRVTGGDFRVCPISDISLSLRECPPHSDLVQGAIATIAKTVGRGELWLKSTDPNTVSGSGEIESYGGLTRMKDLAGRTAFVTGAASGIATALSQAGAKVMLCDIEEESTLLAFSRLS
jgi:hypothetical protein